jgi:putative transposase
MSPAAKRRAVDMLKDALSMSERLMCNAVGLARSTYRNLPQAQTRPIRTPRFGSGCVTTPRKARAMGFGGRWRRCVTKAPRNKQGQGAEETGGGVVDPADLRRRTEGVWANDFQFDSTIDGKPIGESPILSPPVSRAGFV